MLILTSAVGAEARILKGLEPSFKFEQKYDDNIYLTKENKNWDYITEFTPTIDYTIKPRKISKGRISFLPTIVLRLKTEIRYYVNNKDLNGGPINGSGWFPAIDVGVNFSERLKGYYKIKKSQSTPGELYTRNDEARDNRFIDYLSETYGLDYTIGPKYCYFDLSYGHSGTRYLTSEEEDDTNERDTFAIVNYIKFLPGTFLMSGASQEHVTYPQKGRTNSVYNRIYTGITGKFSNKISGQVTIGYSKRRGKSKGGLTTNSNLKYAFSKRLSFNAGLNADLTEATQFNENEDRSITLRGGFNYIPARFNKKLTLTGMASVKLSGLSNTESSDDEQGDTKQAEYTTMLGAGYRINENMDLTGKYKYKTRVSESENNEYTDNQITVTLNTRF